MQPGYLIKVLSPALLAVVGLALIFVTLRPAQAAPLSRRLETNILVTTTIQAAINAAAAGDTVIIPAGIYTESLTLSKAVSLTGVSSATTIIQALANQRVLTVTGAVISNSVVISGLTLTGGRASPGWGGGILVTNNARPLLQSLIVTNNQAGYGGGVFMDFNIPVTLVEVIVISNSATTDGGGLFGGGPVTLTHSRFERNRAISGGGGGLVAAGVTLTDSEFINNSAAGLGGGAASIGSTIVTGGRFEGNVGNSGGGLYVNFSLVLTGTQFLRNQANNGGGLFDGGTSNDRLLNALFAGNTVTNTGAALYLGSSGSTALLHTTIADTSLNPKAAIAVVNGSIGVTNTIIASHTFGISQTAGTVFEDYNLFFDTLPANGSVGSGGHSLSGNPRFIAPGSDDYHLSAGSSALNEAFPGLSTIDFEGDARPLGQGPDIGFDESLFSPALTITKTVNPVGLLEPGQTLTYTIIVSNYGEAAANNVLITDTLPASITGMSLFTTSTILADQSIIFTLTGIVTENVSTGAVITNIAYYSHTSGQGQANASSTTSQSSSPNNSAYLPLILKN